MPKRKEFSELNKRKKDRQVRMHEIELENKRREHEVELENKRREHEVELENKRREIELENKRREADLETKRCEMELENKRCELELRQKELELKDREKEREYQLQLKQVENKGNDDADNESFTHERSIDYKVLPTQHKREDVLEFFNLFEKTAKLHNIDEKRWHFSIGNKFNDATRQVFQRLFIEEMQSYAQIKEALLKTFQVVAVNTLHKIQTFRKRSERYI